MLVEALLSEIASALATGEVGNDQDQSVAGCTGRPPCSAMRFTCHPPVPTQLIPALQSEMRVALPCYGNHFHSTCALGHRAAMTAISTFQCGETSFALVAQR
jgi:hypothetical protein